MEDGISWRHYEIAEGHNSSVHPTTVGVPIGDNHMVGEVIAETGIGEDFIQFFLLGELGVCGKLELQHGAKLARKFTIHDPFPPFEPLGISFTGLP